LADINDIISPEALKGLEQMNTALDRAVVSLDKVAQQSAALDATLSRLAATTKDNKTAQEGVNNAQKQAQQLNTQLKQSEEEVVKAKLKFARAAKDQREAISANIVLEDREAGTLEKLAARNKQLREEQRKLNLETKQGIARNKEINAEINKNTAFTKKNSDQLVQHRINVGNYSSALGGLPGPIGMAATAFKSFTAVILANPIGAVILAIVGAIALLVKAFKGTEEGGDRIVRVFAQIKAVIDAVFDRVKNLATGLFKVFSGEAKLKDLKGTFAGLGDEIKREVDLAGQLADMMDQLEDREIDMIVISADRKAKIDKLREAAADSNKTDKEKLSLLSQAKKLIDEEAAAQQKLQLTRIANELGLTDEAQVLERINQVRKEGKQITLDEIGLAIATNVDRKRVNELLAQYIGFEEQAATESRRLVTTMSTLAEGVKKEAEFQELANAAGKKTIEIKQEQTKTVQDYFDKANKLNSTELLFNEQIMDSNERLQQQKRKQFEEELQMQQQLRSLKVEIANSAFNLGATLMDRQAAKLDTAYNAEVKAAGDNAEKKAEIDEKYAKKRNELARKQAVVDKLQGLFNIAINTAMGVMNAMSKVITIPLVPWIVAMGAIQAATVLATPIPQYAKGTHSSRAGIAVVGERGRELMVDPSGHMSLSGDSAHLAMLKAGTRIIPSDETKAIMRAAGANRRSTIEATIEKGNRDIVKAINEKESLILNTSVGGSIIKRKGNIYKEYFDRHLQ